MFGGFFCRLFTDVVFVLFCFIFIFFHVQVRWFDNAKRSKLKLTSQRDYLRLRRIRKDLIKASLTVKCQFLITSPRDEYTTHDQFKEGVHTHRQMQRWNFIGPCNQSYKNIKQLQPPPFFRSGNPQDHTHHFFLCMCCCCSQGIPRITPITFLLLYLQPGNPQGHTHRFLSFFPFAQFEEMNIPEGNEQMPPSNCKMSTKLYP